MKNERIARMLGRLAAKTGFYGERIEGGGGSRGLSPMALSRLLGEAIDDPVTRLLLLVKYAGMEQQRGTLEFAVIGLADKMDWRCKDREVLRRLVKQAVLETVEADPCAMCRGEGTILGRMEKKAPCRRCRGEGKNPVSGRARQRAIGVTEPTWRRVWRSRFDALSSALSWRETKGLEVIAQKLKEARGAQ